MVSDARTLGRCTINKVSVKTCDLLVLCTCTHTHMFDKMPGRWGLGEHDRKEGTHINHYCVIATVGYSKT